MKIEIANKNDAKSVLDAIKGIATAEQKLEAVTATKELIKKNLFTDNNIVFKITEDDKIVGIAILYKTFLTFSAEKGLFLETMFIYPEFQRKGYGYNLIKHIVNFAKENNYSRIAWFALDNNGKALSFYKNKIRARTPKGKVYFRLEKEDIESFGK